MSSAWWAAMSSSAKKVYIAKHPNSKYAKNAKKNASKTVSLNAQLTKAQKRLSKLKRLKSNSSQTTSSRRTAASTVRNIQSQLRTLKRGV